MEDIAFLHQIPALPEELVIQIVSFAGQEALRHIRSVDRAHARYIQQIVDPALLLHWKMYISDKTELTNAATIDKVQRARRIRMEDSEVTTQFFSTYVHPIAHRSSLIQPTNINLCELDLSRCGLKELPRDIGRLSTLRKLMLHGNYFTSLPGEIGMLKSLQILNLTENSLQSLPETFGHMTSLKTLTLRVNHLKNLPSSFGKLHALESLCLNNNQLATAPECLWELTNLRSLMLGANGISSLPDGIGQLINLKMLALHMNSLSELPDTFATLQSLERLFLSRNRFAELPLDILHQLSCLRYVDLSWNRASFPIRRCGHLELVKETLFHGVKVVYISNR